MVLIVGRANFNWRSARGSSLRTYGIHSAAVMRGGNSFATKSVNLMRADWFLTLAESFNHQSEQTLTSKSTGWIGLLRLAFFFSLT